MAETWRFCDAHRKGVRGSGEIASVYVCVPAMEQRTEGGGGVIGATVHTMRNPERKRSVSIVISACQGEEWRAIEKEGRHGVVSTRVGRGVRRYW